MTTFITCIITFANAYNASIEALFPCKLLSIIALIKQTLFAPIFHSELDTTI